MPHFVHSSAFGAD